MAAPVKIDPATGEVIEEKIKIDPATGEVVEAVPAKRIAAKGKIEIDPATGEVVESVTPKSKPYTGARYDMPVLAASEKPKPTEQDEAEAKAGRAFRMARANRPVGAGPRLTTGEYASDKTGISREEPIAAVETPKPSSTARYDINAARAGSGVSGRVLTNLGQGLDEIIESTTLPIRAFLQGKSYDERLGEKVLEATESLKGKASIRDAKKRAAEGKPTEDDKKVLEADETLNKLHSAWTAVKENPSEVAADLFFGLIEDLPAYLITAPLGGEMVKLGQGLAKSTQQAARMAKIAERFGEGSAAAARAARMTGGVAKEAGTLGKIAAGVAEDIPGDVAAGAALSQARGQDYDASQFAQDLIPAVVLGGGKAALGKIGRGEKITAAEAAEVRTAVADLPEAQRVEAEENLAPVLEEAEAAVEPPASAAEAPAVVEPVQPAEVPVQPAEAVAAPESGVVPEEAAAEAPAAAAITPEAQAILAAVDAGGVPGFMTRALRGAAEDNGITVKDTDTPSTVIEALRSKRDSAPEASAVAPMQAATPEAAAVEAPADAVDVPTIAAPGQTVEVPADAPPAVAVPTAPEQPVVAPDAAVAAPETLTPEAPAPRQPAPRPDVVDVTPQKPFGSTPDGLVRAPDPEERVTSARKSFTTTERARLGLDEIPSPTRTKWTETLQKAKDDGLDGEAEALADAIIESKRALNDVETAGMVIRMEQLLQQHDAGMARIETLKDADQIAEQAAVLKKIEDRFDNVSRAVRYSGTEKGRNLAAQKLTINKSYDLVPVLNRVKANKGAELTPKERAKFEKEVEGLKAANKELEDFYQKKNEILARSALQESRKRPKREPKEVKAQIADLTEKTRRLLRAGCLTG